MALRKSHGRLWHPCIGATAVKLQLACARPLTPASRPAQGAPIKLEVWDEDSGLEGADDLLGTVSSGSVD